MRQELDELNSSLGKDENGMTVHEKLDRLLNSGIGNSIDSIQGKWSGSASIPQITNAVIGELYYLVENTVNTFTGAEIIDMASITNFQVYILKATSTTITAATANTVWLFTKFGS